jgi:hypothetical protein
MTARDIVVLPTPLVVPAMISDGRKVSKELIELILVSQYLSY